MPTQFPTLSIGEQTSRWTDMAKSNLVPYSYELYLQSSDSASYPTAITYNGLVYRYLTIQWQADNNLAIADLEFNAGINIATDVTTLNASFIFEVSYASVLDPNILVLASGAPPTNPIAPKDIGNIIYRNVQNIFVPTTAAGQDTSNNVTSAYRRYEPYNYLVKYNQSIYMHIAVDAFTLARTPLINASFIFHTLATGLKV